MIRVFIPLAILLSATGVLWWAVSEAASLLSRMRLRAGHAAALAAGRTSTTDVQAYVAENARQETFRNRLLMGLLVFVPPALAALSVIYSSMYH